MGAAFVLLASPVTAQTTSAPAGQAATSAKEEKQDTVVLATFVVNSEKDTGYIASDTISVSRLSTSLLNTPSDISILTSEFISDLGTKSIADVELYLTNASPRAPSGDGYTFGTDVDLRGLPTSNNLRNYFNMQTNTVNQYIIDRVEGMRGTNSILYGPTNIGGLVNLITKQAQFRNFSNVKLQTDSQGTLIGAIDVNRALNDKFAIRVNATAQNERNWESNWYKDLRAADVTFTYQPYKGTKIRFEAEDSYLNQYNSSRNFSNNASNWNGVGVTDLSGTTPVGSEGVSIKSSDYLVYSPNAWNGIMNFKGLGESTGSGLKVVDGTPRPTANYTVLTAKDFRAAPKDSHSYQKDYVFQLNIEQQLPGNGVFEVAAFRVQGPGGRFGLDWGNVFVDTNKILPDGSANPNFGKLYTDSSAEYSTKYDQYRTNYRAAVAYPLVTRWGRQDFSFIADQWSQKFFPVSQLLSRTNNTTTPDGRNAANQIKIRQYWDKRDDSLTRKSMELPGTQGPYQVGWITTRKQHSGSTLHGYSLNTSGNWFDGKLNIVGGIRRDYWSGYAEDVSARDASGQPSAFSTNRFRASPTSGNGGFVYFPVDFIGVYANYQKGFNPLTLSTSTAVTLSGKTLEPATIAKGQSAGIRLKLLEGRVVGSVGYYEIEESNRFLSRNLGSINTIWRELGMSQNEIVSGNNSYGDTQSYRGHGVEGEITANVTKNLRMMFNVAFPRTEQTDGDLDTLNYYNAHIAQWRSAAALLPVATQNTITTNIANIESIISSAANGRTLNGTFKYRANFHGVYAFDQGPLKGLRLGGGVRLHGKQLIGSPTGQPFTYLYARSYAIFGASAGYKFSDKLDVQLNVENLFNYDKPVFTGTTTLAGVNYFNDYWYYQPVTGTLTLKYSF